MKITLIACVYNDCGIGINGDMLVHIPADLKMFREYTMGKPVIMGYNTYMSLPERKPLDGRINIIMSRSLTDAPDGFLLAHSKNEALVLAQNSMEYSGMSNSEKEIVIIGGNSIYKLFLEDATKMKITHVDRYNSDADTYFPVNLYNLRYDSGNNRTSWNVNEELCLVQNWKPIFGEWLKDSKCNCAYRFETWEKQ